jgi:hypothetical protein
MFVSAPVRVALPQNILHWALLSSMNTRRVNDLRDLRIMYVIRKYRFLSKKSLGYSEANLARFAALVNKYFPFMNFTRNVSKPNSVEMLLTPIFRTASAGS